mgnify:CR=1 FL=1
MFCINAVFGAGWLVESGFVRDPRAYYGLIALTPAVFFSTILASFRGYFQGYQMMTPPAVSQILEQFTRVVTMVVLAYCLLPYGLEYAAAGAAFGAVPGAITGLIVLSFFFRRLRKIRRYASACQYGNRIRLYRCQKISAAGPASFVRQHNGAGNKQYRYAACAKLPVCQRLYNRTGNNAVRLSYWHGHAACYDGHYSYGFAGCRYCACHFRSIYAW